MLGIGQHYSKDLEIGVGYAHNPNAKFRHYWAIHITRRDEGDRFLTGTVFEDANNNTRYDPGEGLPGVRIIAKPFATNSNTAGGWSIRVPPGDYEITAHGSAFEGTSYAEVTVTDKSIGIDFISGLPRGVVDFDTAS
jgi:hypothetical protein